MIALIWVLVVVTIADAAFGWWLSLRWPLPRWAYLKRSLTTAAVVFVVQTILSGMDWRAAVVIFLICTPWGFSAEFAALRRDQRR